MGIVIWNLHRSGGALMDRARYLTSQPLPLASVLPPEDSTLISERYKNNISVNEVIQSKNRNPIALTFFDSSYNLFIYKIDLLNKIEHIGKLVGIFKDKSKVSYGYAYSELNNKNDLPFQLKYVVDSIHSAANILLRFDSDTTQLIIKNDSIIYYHLSCNSLSLGYSNQPTVDLLFEAKNEMFRKGMISTDVLFIKRNDTAYFLMMTPNNIANYIPSLLLYDIVMSK